ncbi:hypothetical protein NP493_779g01025 [Ridgeia piscesae]|uniref:Uncharacterized protein n=1 Tax=Ridgeia piscesae TaxID=27915 RepID=A0AAD9KQ20_RIDPI|nr:hypothetical protein NP493_779g01025 [Ridgeia piscesae]
MCKSILSLCLLCYGCSADEDIDSTFPTNVIVSSNGDCLWVPPGLFFSTCKIDITWFPFDDQQCKMKFGSWTYDGSAIDLQLKMDGGDTSSFIANGEWDLIGVPAERHVLKYACCPERYIDITFTIHIRRRTLYYGFNLIIPCVLISSMALLAFSLPPDTGEKISLGVTILLSLTVFLLLVAETMPPTSDAVPLIGMYFACIMLMCSLSVVFTVLVLNYHHRTPDTHEMPDWVKKFICEWLAWLLRMRRPGCSNICDKRRSSKVRTPDHEMAGRSSRSLLANVLDLDDDFGGAKAYCNGVTIENGGLAVTELSSGGASYQLKYILKELKVLTNKVKSDEEVADKCNDWKFAALVIDRLCLWMFTVFTIVSTMAIIFSAPHVIV